MTGEEEKEKKAEIGLFLKQGNTGSPLRYCIIKTVLSICWSDHWHGVLHAAAARHVLA